MSSAVFADTTSSGATTNTLSNSSGSNTTITGGYSQESTTTYQSGSSSNTTSTTNNNSYTGDTRVVPSASAPSISAMSQDLCRVGVSLGGQSFGFGLSTGTTIIDENCERMKLSKLLYDYNMKVAAVAILCQDDRVFSAMENAGTPCPFEGMIGEDAKAQWKKYDKERPDYKQYTEKLKVRNDIEAGQIILTQEQAINNNLLEIKRLKEVNAQVVVNTITQIDSVFVPFYVDTTSIVLNDSIVDMDNFIQVPQIFSLDKEWFSFGGQITKTGLLMDSLSFRNELTHEYKKKIRK